jgi:tungstate transport system permease protein
MDEFGRAFAVAVDLILRRDPELVRIVILSLRVSLTATAFAFLIGAPLGAAFARLASAAAPPC